LVLGDLKERYDNKDDYLEQVRAAAQALSESRLVLAEDIELCVTIAAERYDAALTELRGTAR
jgi:hypothetical protein